MKGFWDVPCVDCIVYAACRSKTIIECEILYKHFRKKCPLKNNPEHFAFDIELDIARRTLNDYIVVLNKFETAILDVRKLIVVYEKEVEWNEKI